MTGSNSQSDQRRPVRRRVGALWLLGLLVGVLISLSLGDRIRNAVFDRMQIAAPRDLSASDVRVVLVDNHSVRTVGPWPWPRYYLARLTEELSGRGAKIVAYDILFSEPDRVRPDIFVSLYPELSDGAASEVNQLPTMDSLFGQVIGMSPVVLAHAGTGDSELAPPALAETPVEGRVPSNLERWQGELAAIPELDDVALGHGLVNARPDYDGITRTVPLLLKVGDEIRPGFAFEIARNALGVDKARATPRSIAMGNKTVAVDSEARMRLHFGEFPAQRIFSAADLLGRSDRIADDEFEGKVVLVGASADGTSDIAATPAKSEEYGPLVQAQAVDALLRGGWLERPAWTAGLEWGVASLLALLSLGLGSFGRGYRLAVMGAFLAIPLASWAAFATSSLLLDPARPLLVGGGALAGVALGLFSAARSERERLRESLVEERVAAAETAGELEAARAIQLGMVPPRSKLHGLDRRVDVDALLEPAKSVGGDFYDAVMIGENRLAVVVADVTGKGVPAALFMAMSKALTGAALTQADADPATMIAAINTQLLKEHGEAMSVTMLLAILDLRDGEMKIACAGHEDPLIVKPDGEIRRVRLDGGPPLSIVPFDYPPESLSLDKGEILLLITDGVTEAQDADGELFGVERVIERGAALGQTAQDVCETLRDRVREFEGETEATDDLTVLAVRYIGA